MPQARPPRLWSAVLLLGLALAAAQTACALSPQPEPPVASRYRLPWVARKWQPAAQAPLVNRTVSAAGRRLKAVTLSPQPEPPLGGRARGQRFARWAAAVPLMKTTTTTLVPSNSTAAAGRGFKSHATASHDSVLGPEYAVEQRHDPAGAAGAHDSLQALGLFGRRLVGDEALGYFEACNKGKKFKTAPCGSWSIAPELSWFGRNTRTHVLEVNTIECVYAGSHSRRPDKYHVKVDEVFGKRAVDSQPGYYARARITHDGRMAPEWPYCWSRVGSDQDMYWCQCEVALHGSDLGHRSACHCFSG